MTSLDNPEVRALASRYGNPDELLQEDWRPGMPGINQPGNYADYAQDPWKFVWGDIEKVMAGTYAFFYPARPATHDDATGATATSARARSEAAMTITSRLLRILGRRAFITFGLVTFLVSALLATVNLTSRYALKVYVEDQLSRIPWDLAIYQRGGITGRDKLPGAVAQVDGITDVESLVFLRARFPEGGEVTSEVDGKPLTAPWMCLLAASDTSILPPQLAFALDRAPADNGEAPTGAVLALVGPERAMGSAFLALQGSQGVLGPRQDAGGQGAEAPVHHAAPRRNPPRSRRAEPLADGSDRFGQLRPVHRRHPADAARPERHCAVRRGGDRHRADGSAGAGRDRPRAPAACRVRAGSGVSRRSSSATALISGWDIAGSLDRVIAVNNAVNDAAVRVSKRAENDTEPHLAPGARSEGSRRGREKAPGDYGQFVVDSTTEVLLGRMENIARLVGVLSLLVALPLLWMAWVLGANLAGLLMLNERRTLGLMRLRGISGQAMGRALLIAIVSGGAVGGVLGSDRGIGRAAARLRARPPARRCPDAAVAAAAVRRLPRHLGHPRARREPPAGEVRDDDLAARSVPTGLGLRDRVACRCRSACCRRCRWCSAATCCSAGPSTSPRPPAPGTLVSARSIGGSTSSACRCSSTASPRCSPPSASASSVAMAPIVKPIGGRLAPFAMRHISVKPHRAMAFLLIVALMTGVSLYPTITSPSFSDKAERGARVQLGTDWQLLYNAPDLADIDRASRGRRLAAAGAAAGDRCADRVAEERAGRALGDLDVESVLPSFYLPGYGLKGVPLYLLGKSDELPAERLSRAARSA